MLRTRTSVRRSDRGNEFSGFVEGGESLAQELLPSQEEICTVEITG